MLAEIFGRYGEIKNVIMSKDVSPGWAFIEYTTEHMAMLAAKSLDGIIGKVLKMNDIARIIHMEPLFSPSKSQA